MQDLANGHLDVKALGEAANGDENTIVTTRTGNTYPSAERAINIMFKNGGLPAIPFATKALMTASALADGKYAMVTDDTVNNGLYVKTAGAWVKSDYDPVGQANSYTNSELQVSVEDYATDARLFPEITSAGALPENSLNSLEHKRIAHTVLSLKIKLGTSDTTVAQRLVGKLGVFTATATQTATVTKVRHVADINYTGKVNVTLDFTAQPVVLAANEFLAIEMSERLLRFSSQNTNYETLSTASWAFLPVGDSRTQYVNWNANSYKMAYELSYFVYKDVPLGTVAVANKSDLRDLSGRVITLEGAEGGGGAVVNDLPMPYVSVFHDNFFATNAKWVDKDNTWVRDLAAGTIKPTAVGEARWVGPLTETNTLKLDLTYHANRRNAAFRISFKSNTVIEIATFNKVIYYPDGGRIIRFDVAAKKITFASATGAMVKEITLADGITPDRDYVVTVSVKGMVESVTITDYITGTSQIAELVNTLGGSQCENYILSLKSGAAFTLKEVDVSVLNRPKAYIVGDSITAYVGSSADGWAYKLSKALNDNCVIAARGNADASSISALFESEIKHIKPEYLIWSHGHNGEGITQSRLDAISALCLANNIKLYVNHITCKTGDAHIIGNNLIELNNFKGCRFDIATARNSNPYLVDGDTAPRADATLYSDVQIHPNAAGHQKMWERLPIDMPEILY